MGVEIGIIIAVEGGDASGKALATTNIVAHLNAHGVAAEALSFPRFGDSISGRVIGEYLAGKFNGVTPREVATLFAMDRMASIPAIAEAQRRSAVVIMDRYTASNIVYQSAREPDEAQAVATAAWIEHLELAMGIPPATLTLLLATPAATSYALMARKPGRAYTDAVRDRYESDSDLQHKIRASYLVHAHRDHWTTVHTVADGELRDPLAIADECCATIYAELLSASNRRLHNRTAR